MMHWYINVTFKIFYIVLTLCTYKIQLSSFDLKLTNIHLTTFVSPLASFIIKSLFTAGPGLYTAFISGLFATTAMSFGIGSTNQYSVEH